MAEDFAATLEARKARSTVQLLLKAARLLNERAILRMREKTRRPVRTAHTTLLPHIDLAGTRLTDLAARLGVTKQAASQLVDELVDMGMLERVPDPADARAKLIRFSKLGQKALLQGIEVFAELEDDIEERIGSRALEDLHAALSAVVSAEIERASGREAEPT